MCLNKLFIKLIPDFSSLGIIYCPRSLGNKDISFILRPSPTHIPLSPHISKSCYNLGLNSYLVDIIIVI